MKVLLWADMEGMSGVVDYTECIPVFSEYWRSGRTVFTAEVAAATEGLLRGGATEVVVADGHGLDWPNVLWEQLPGRARPWQDPDEEIDGLFEIGRHARCGTEDGFMSHTIVPYLAVAMHGTPATESHLNAMRAWRFGAPVLGIAGDESLERQLDGAVSATPFLAVKRSASRTWTTRLCAGEALSDFAAACVRAQSERSVPPPRGRYRLSCSFTDPAMSGAAEGRRGWERAGPSSLTTEQDDWFEGVLPALGAAEEAAAAPMLALMGDLSDISGEDDLASWQPERLEAARGYFTEWVFGAQPAWRE